ncbi:class I SAM-dependent methyltransferase [Chitinophaga sp. S165]|uniref:class I SAM-dependent methyltransferase n=1 Tax=Chitinophaga sp. S165 TaxID=2135462 RepID=UPI000D714AE5|nr:class I SAM-dependent methyltransferase [Chitinophaga sp. S165]PWV45380.1 methyltransferase family protein [Chitinophaga sp. S165]
MEKTQIEKMSGHWLLAKMGKRVLRPGGKELTLRLLENLNITERDHVVEFAPGMGFAAALTLKKNPRSYIGIELDEAAVHSLSKRIKGEDVCFMHANAVSTGLPAESKDKVYGEAMLTMHADHRKVEIIREAARILRKGGLYAIHELGLIDNAIEPTAKADIQRELALVTKVNARPLTAIEWQQLLEENGFEVKAILKHSMHLLEPGRIVSDEGLLRALKIGFNILTHAEARKRILAMRRVFNRYRDQMNAVVMIAERV